MLISSRKLRTFLLNNKEAIQLNEKFIDNLFVDKELEEKIASIFDQNYNIKDDATVELLNLRTSLKAQIQNLKNTIDNLLKDSTFTSYLQDTIVTERMGRTCFQVKASDKSKVKGIVHDVSASNQTFFIELL